MHYEMMTVTPELAQRWLDQKNTRNRNISEKKVRSYADDMKSGRWHPTHQNAIAFYKDGNLADGQHRLSAIVSSGVSLEFMVWWGLDNKSAYGIDAHRMRKTDDQIKIAGGADWVTKDVVACARVMASQYIVTSPQKIVEFCETHKEAIEFAFDNMPRSAGPASLRAAVAVAFYHVPSDKLASWCEIMATGIGAIPLSRTVLSLRERMIKDRAAFYNGGSGREALIKLAMRSIQAYCDGQVLSRFPEPKDRIYEIPS